MKLILAFIVVMLPFFGFTQEILKNADTIIVKNDQSAGQNFQLVKKLLADDEIEIATQDSSSNQFETGRIRLANNLGYHYLIDCKQGRITVSGTVEGKNGMTGSYGNGVGISIPIGRSRKESYPITNKGFMKVIFKRMDDFAKKLGDNISYTASTVKTKKKADQVN